jgi:lipoic acid synthetase
MVGLGEEREEVLGVLKDLREAGCGLLSIGQYLAPTGAHMQAREYVSPDLFAFYKEAAKKAGFSHVESGPYVRTSYMAHYYV